LLSPKAFAEYPDVLTRKKPKSQYIVLKIVPPSVTPPINTGFERFPTTAVSTEFNKGVVRVDKVNPSANFRYSVFLIFSIFTLFFILLLEFKKSLINFNNFQEIKFFPHLQL